LRRTLKLRYDMPYPERNRLYDKGYRFEKHVHNQYDLFVKIDPSNENKITDTVHYLQNQPLTPGEEYSLEARCDRIVNFFADPYAHEEACRGRLMRLVAILPTVAQQEFVLEYIKDNFPTAEDLK